MRTLLIGCGVAIAALAANVNLASAQYNAEWCIADGLHGPGSMDCAYHTFQQCRESRSGNGGTCVQNPDRIRGGRTTGRGSRRYNQGSGY